MVTPFRRSPVLLAVLAAALAAGPARSDDKAPKARQPPADSKAAIPDLLAKRVSLDKPFEGTFGDAVKMLAEKYDLPLVVDPSLDQPDLGNVAERSVKLPRLVDVRADTFLRLLSDQVGGAFLVYPGYVKLVSEEVALQAAGVGNDPPTPVLGVLGGPNPFGGLGGPVQPEPRALPLTKKVLVTASFKGKPVSEILDAIAEATGTNVVVAPQVADKAQQAITVRFTNTPVDAAVRTVCEMADLGVIEDANVLLVTTKERAAARAREADEKRRARLAEASGLGGLGLGLGAAGGPADVAAELARLKEQNDQLKRQLDELQRQLPKK